MKIDTRHGQLTLLREGGQWALTRSLIDPLIVVASYLLIVPNFGHHPTRDDLVLLLLAGILSFPGKLPFHRFSSGHVVRILIDWTAVIGILLLFRLAYLPPDSAGALLLERATWVWFVAVPLALVAVHLISPGLAPYLKPLYKQSKVVIVGVTQVALRLAEVVNSGDAEGQRIVGYFDDRQIPRFVAPGLPALGGMDDVADYVKTHGIDIIYISLPMTSQPRIVALLEKLRDTTASIWFLPDIFVADLIQGRVEVVSGVPIVSVCDTPFHGLSGLLKRCLDLVLVLMALPLVVPLMAAIAFAIRATSPGPALFRQKRYGLDGKPIVVWKFRTMRTLEDGDKTYRQVTRDDDRVTPIGKLLRKTSLDELPQLINVLVGSMSLVGPRPHALAVNEQYRKLIPGYMVRHKVKPGISGWAQVNGCRGGDDLDSMRRRTEFDLAYLRSWSISLDLLIIWKTIVMLTRGDPKAY